MSHMHAKHDSYDGYRSKRSSTRVPAPHIASHFEHEATGNIYKVGNENQVEPLRSLDDNRGARVDTAESNSQLRPR